MTCGGGTTERRRACDDPAPQHGGSDCSGSSLESLDCNTQACQGSLLLFLLRQEKFILQLMEIGAVGLVGPSVHKVVEEEPRQEQDPAATLLLRMVVWTVLERVQTQCCATLPHAQQVTCC